MAKAIARLVTLALLLWTPCASDSHWRFVTGVVTDKRGNGLAHAVVQLEDEIRLSVRSYITGDDGRYHFSEVNADIDYHLRARYRMHWSKPHSLSRFDSPKDHDDIRLVIRSTERPSPWSFDVGNGPLTSPGGLPQNSLSLRRIRPSEVQLAILGQSADRSGSFAATHKHRRWRHRYSPPAFCIEFHQYLFMQNAAEFIWYFACRCE